MPDNLREPPNAAEGQATFQEPGGEGRRPEDTGKVTGLSSPAGSLAWQARSQGAEGKDLPRPLPSLDGSERKEGLSPGAAWQQDNRGTASLKGTKQKPQTPGEPEVGRQLPSQLR